MKPSNAENNDEGKLPSASWTKRATANTAAVPDSGKRFDGAESGLLCAPKTGQQDTLDRLSDHSFDSSKSTGRGQNHAPSSAQACKQIKRAV